MKLSRVLFLLAWLIIFSGLFGCSAEKEISSRRNFMMPEKTDLPRNSKYVGTKKKKTYKPKKRKKRKPKKLCNYYAIDISGIQLA